MTFDLRAAVIAASLILASIAVAAAEGAQDQPARPAAPATDHAGAAQHIRVILPAPWEPAPASSGAQAMVQK
ncbi:MULTISPECIES: hypothetical protein [unclassified Bradyrhizobium]|uniref:hypothetical protein n=1 Tax=unclassified Bradyrhizobium TaxID=2631580 RepID=UPI00188A3BB6|nr:MULTISPECIES: hypothetical protein [unclassified Bradyrhizobium]MDN4982524.1 hypothetical protein [Bradyrhizobium sp. WYCCWR 13022]QOZ53506.1 hypothetical protein XH90_20615 [Bradyrhizobium sp. CCBAU 53338]